MRTWGNLELGGTGDGLISACLVFLRHALPSILELTRHLTERSIFSADAKVVGLMSEPESVPPVIDPFRPSRGGVVGRIGLAFSIYSLAGLAIMLVFRPSG